MISVIVPVYNVETYLRKTIESVLEQTYGEWELLLVNDGSTDKSPKICEEYQAKDERIKLINKSNGGVSSARNAGIEAACGEWIAFLDGDDWYESDCLEKAIAEADNTHDMVCWNFWENTDQKEEKNKKIVPEKIVVENPRELMKITMFPQYSEKTESCTFSGIKGVWCKLVRRELLEQHQIRFDSRLKIGEDALFSFRCFEHAGKVTFVNQYLYHYRIDNLSATRRFRPDIAEVYKNTLGGFTDAVRPYREEEGMAVCYGGLTYACVARSLEKYFFHKENKQPLVKKLRELKSYLMDEKNPEGNHGNKTADNFSAETKSDYFLYQA